MPPQRGHWRTDTLFSGAFFLFHGTQFILNDVSSPWVSGQLPVEPEKAPVFFEGVCEGEIAREEGGLRLRCHIRPKGDTRTFAELPRDVKDALSHRGQAAESFLKHVIATNS